jgi:hypothetical protein
MTADRVVVLILIVAGIAWGNALGRRRLARMTLEERAQFDRNMAPFARTVKVFLWLLVVLGVLGAIGAAVDGVWPASISLLVTTVAVGYGLAYRSRWWLGQ